MNSQRMMSGRSGRTYSCTSHRPSIGALSPGASRNAASASLESSSWTPRPLPPRLGFSTNGHWPSRSAAASTASRPTAAMVAGTVMPARSNAVYWATLLTSR